MSQSPRYPARLSPCDVRRALQVRSISSTGNEAELLDEWSAAVERGESPWADDEEDEGQPA